MGRKPKKMSPAADRMSSSSAEVAWRFTKIMNMRDLSRDDDYLSHLFVEKLGSLGSTSALLVHKMDPLRRLPKTDTGDILAIVQRLIRSKLSGSASIKQAVNELLELPSVLYFIKEYDQSQINAFATHGSRYLELFSPSGSIEIAQTSRYSKWTGKSELCILATRPMQPGFLIAELKGSMADLTEEEDRELKRTGPRNDGGTRRDFSVIHSKQLKKNHLFLGPARFVNHDCDNNSELFRNGRYITFRAIKPIAVGQEITAHYGNGYFGKNNRHCLCETCERLGKGGYAPQSDSDEPCSPGSNSSGEDEDDSDSDTTSVASVESVKGKEEVNLNERRTRRGVYLVLPEQQNESDDSDEEDEGQQPDAKNSDASSTQTSVSSDVIDLTVDLAESSSAAQSVSTNRSSPVSSEREALPEQPPRRLEMETRSAKARREASLSEKQAAEILNEKELRSGSVRRSPRSSVSSTSLRKLPVRKSRSSTSSESISNPSSGCVVKAKAKNSASPPIKTEEKEVSLNTEARVLRTRPSTSSIAAVKPADADKIGKQQKGTPLTPPTCITCAALLPLNLEGGRTHKGKVKEIKEECTRCKRHFLIFNAPWPQRNPLPGSGSSSTPRENTPSDFSQKGKADSAGSLSEKRLKAAWLEHLKRLREKDESATSEEIVRPAKKQKVGAASQPASTTATIATTAKKTDQANKANQSTTQARKEIIDTVINKAPSTKNGKKRSAEDDTTLDHTSKHKKGKTEQDSERLSTPPREADENPAYDDRRDKTFWPVESSNPPLGLGIKRIGLLYSRPNPALVSRWRSSPMCSAHSSESTPTLVDDDTDEATSDEHPTTPEHDVRCEKPDDLETATTCSRSMIQSDTEDLHPVSDEDEGNEIDGFMQSQERVSAPVLKSMGLISKPSPLAIAKRVWAPPALIVADPDDEDFFSPLHEPSTPQHTDRRSLPITPTQQRLESSPLNYQPPGFFQSRAQKSIFDDFDISSGEEDVIIPGPPDSRLYLLQKVSFSPISQSHSSPHRNLTSPSTSNGISSHQEAAKTDAMPGSPKAIHDEAVAEVLQPSVPLSDLTDCARTFGHLHSGFSPLLTEPSPCLVNAAWESDSSLCNDS